MAIEITLPMLLAGVWLAGISLIAVVVTIVDKGKAKRGAWRVPESTLLILSALGGSVAMYITMLAIRHKTRHSKFMVGIPLILLFQAVAVGWCIWKFL